MVCPRSVLLLSLPLFASVVPAQGATTVLYRHYRPHCWSLGNEMLGIGDVNRDGYGDYAISATESPYRVDYPFVEAISGRDGMQLWEVRGAANSRLGAAMTLGADYNQDGLPDLLVGAPRWSNGDGQVYLLSANNGQTLCGFRLVPNLPPRFIGVRADHAAVVFCPSLGCADLVTNARPVTFVQ